MPTRDAVLQVGRKWSGFQFARLLQISDLQTNVIKLFLSVIFLISKSRPLIMSLSVKF